MKFAVIETDGKQYLVKVGDKVKFDTQKGEAGASVSFDKVLLTGDEKKAVIGKPYVDGATIEGKVLRQGRSKKILVMKYHSKTRYRRKRGHRQPFTQVEITKV